MNINLLSIQTVDGLSVIQFLGEPRDTFDYVTALRAHAANHIRVTEVDEAGRVNTLRVENLSERFIFFMDGDLLRGARQDRVLNTSVLLAPRSVTLVPVSCVEAGRWHYVSKDFGIAACAVPSSLRGLKAFHLFQRALVDPTDFQTSQVEVWTVVAALQAKHAASTPTGSLHDVYAARRAAWEETIRALQPVSGANGLAICAGDRLVSLDLFNRAETLEDCFHRILRGVMLDWFGHAAAPRKLDPARLARQLTERLERALAAALPPRPAVGVGTERRFDTPDAVGFALDFQTHRIHWNLMGKAR